MQEENKSILKRILLLFRIGLISAFFAFVADVLLGYGTMESNKDIFEMVLGFHAKMSDVRIFLSAFIGMIAISVEILCYFGIYRLIKGKSSAYARRYKTGIFGMLALAGAGVHVPCCSMIFVYKRLVEAGSIAAVETAMRYAAMFLLPATIIFMGFYFFLISTQISAFSKGMTPYPKCCWVFNPIMGLLMSLILMGFFTLIGWEALGNSLGTSWISIGHIFMYSGLLIQGRKLKA